MEKKKEYGNWKWKLYKESNCVELFRKPFPA